MTKVNKISVCCQKVLPLVYDESLSYYEVLCKVQQKLNELIKINNTIRDEVHKEYVEILETAKQVTEAVASVTTMRDEVLTLKQATEQYAQDVVTVYNETAQAKDTAVSSARSAAQSASSAGQSATLASESAGSASQSANSASSSASSAVSSANSASSSATTATQKAEIAVTNANIAKDNADKVITAMSLVAGTVNLYQRGDITLNVSSSDTETITATVTPTIRNNVLYMNTLITQTLNGQQAIKLPNVKSINLNMQEVFAWMASKLANVNRINLPIVTYGGSRNISLDEYVTDTFNSSASGRGTGTWNYPVQLQVFANKTDILAIDRGKTETLYYNVTIAQPLTFQNEETPTPTDYIAKLNEETQAREQADTQLQANIDTLSNDTFHKNDIIPIANGGTGASDADTAFANLSNVDATENFEMTIGEHASATDAIRLSIGKRICHIECYGQITLTNTTNTDTFVTVASYNVPQLSGYDINICYLSGDGRLVIKNGVISILQYLNKSTTQRVFPSNYFDGLIPFI